MATTKARVTLGKRPESFNATVSAPLPEGGEGLIEVSYRYRTRTEYGQLLDQRMQEAREADAVQEAAEKTAADRGQALPPFSAGDAEARKRDATARHVLDIATGWGLPEPFDLEHVTQLCDELPGMAAAIVDHYRQAIVEGRRGNF